MQSASDNFSEGRALDDVLISLCRTLILKQKALEEQVEKIREPEEEAENRAAEIALEIDEIATEIIRQAAPRSLAGISMMAAAAYAVAIKAPDGTPEGVTDLGTKVAMTLVEMLGRGLFESMTPIF